MFVSDPITFACTGFFVPRSPIVVQLSMFQDALLCIERHIADHEKTTRAESESELIGNRLTLRFVNLLRSRILRKLDAVLYPIKVYAQSEISR